MSRKSFVVDFVRTFWWLRVLGVRSRRISSLSCRCLMMSIKLILERVRGCDRGLNATSTYKEKYEFLLWEQ